jgi:hypothetical protein
LTVPGRDRPPSIRTSTNHLVDDGLKGGYQDELTVGIERLIDPTLSVAVKGIYRRLGRTIEDRCDLDPERPETNGSGCAVINPGSDGRIARGQIPGCNILDDPYYECTDTTSATVRARRLFRGVEVSFRKSVGERLWLQTSYLYSSLRGNFDGGVSMAVGSGQTDPGMNADVDYPSQRQNSYGRLYLDRPHSFRLDGYYVTPFQVFVGLQGYVQSGAPESRLGYSFGFPFFQYGDVWLVKRGTEGRLPTVWEANLTLGYPFRVGPTTVTAQAYVYNLFNNQITTSRDDTWSNRPQEDYPVSIHDPNQPQNNREYGKTTGRQEPRSLRASLKISF